MFLTLRHRAAHCGGCLIADRAIVVIAVDTYLVLFAICTCDPLSIIRSERILECHPRDTVFVAKMALPEVAAHLSVKNCLDVLCLLAVTSGSNLIPAISEIVKCKTIVCFYLKMHHIAGFGKVLKSTRFDEFLCKKYGTLPMKYRDGCGVKIRAYLTYQNSVNVSNCIYQLSIF